MGRGLNLIDSMFCLFGLAGAARVDFALVSGMCMFFFRGYEVLREGGASRPMLD